MTRVTVTAANDLECLKTSQPPFSISADCSPSCTSGAHLRRALLNATIDAAPAAMSDGYLVADILKAYNADGLGLTGHGQEIGILIDTLRSDADPTMFWARSKINNSLANVQKINVGGGPSTLGGG